MSFYWREFYEVDRRIYKRPRLRTGWGTFWLAVRCWRSARNDGRNDG